MSNSHTIRHVPKSRTVRHIPDSSTARLGAFIVVEGCDRAGKSTQCAKLVERLTSEGIAAKLVKFPGRRNCAPDS